MNSLHFSFFTRWPLPLYVLFPTRDLNHKTFTRSIYGYTQNKKITRKVQLNARLFTYNSLSVWSSWFVVCKLQGVASSTEKSSLISRCDMPWKHRHTTLYTVFHIVPQIYTVNHATFPQYRFAVISEASSMSGLLF